MAPPSLIIDDSYRILHLSESAGRFFLLAGGVLTNDVTELVREELRFDLRSALHSAFVLGEASLSPRIVVRFNGTAKEVFLQVRPLGADPKTNHEAIVFFFEGGTLVEPASAAAGAEKSAPISQVRQLEQDLLFTQSHLLASQEEYEGASNDLRTANEELQSINEEYRSSVEELETSKEELQSVNEELQTVNVELKTECERVLQAHSDIQNLITATDVGVLFLDMQLRIHRFTPRITELFNIVAGDEGRLITDFTNSLEYDNLVADVRAVLDENATNDHEVRSRNGAWYLMRMRRYQTIQDKIDGVVVTFVDTSEGRKASESLRASEERFRLLVEEAPDAITLHDVDQDRVIAANTAAARLFGVPKADIVEHGTRHFYAPEQPDGRLVAESFAEHNERALAGEEVHCERRIRRPSGEERICRVTLVRLPSNIHLLRASFVDITDQRATEAELSEVLRGTLEAQEAERQRIARELHDSLRQYLAALNMRLEVFGRSVPDVSPLRSGIAELKGLTVSVEDEVSRLAWELRPIALDDIGLETAIQRLTDEWTVRSGIRMEFQAALKGRKLSPQIETTLYRVLQEGITNIVRHAGAGSVGVTLNATQHGVVMMIEDNGKGFDPEAVNRGSSPHFGLLGMRERLALIHGSLEIETKAGAGTTLIIRAPLNNLSKT